MDLLAPQPRKYRVLCLHSFRTSAAIFQQQLNKAGLIQQLSDILDLTFVDAPHPASGNIPSDVAPFFQGPYYEWFTVESVGDRLEFDEAKVATSERLVAGLLVEAARLGRPYDGLMGFSQGSIMSSAVVALQRAGARPELAAVPPLRFAILFAGMKSRYPGHAAVFKALDKVPCPSLHIIGDKDALKHPHCMDLADTFQASTLLLHQRGHVIPSLQPAQLAVFRAFVAGAMQQVSEEPPQQRPPAPPAPQPMQPWSAHGPDAGGARGSALATAAQAQTPGGHGSAAAGSASGSRL